MSNIDYKFRVESEKYFWSCYTIEEAEKIKQNFQKYVSDTLRIFPIEKEEEKVKNEETGLNH